MCSFTVEGPTPSRSAASVSSEPTSISRHTSLLPWREPLGTGGAGSLAPHAGEGPSQSRPLPDYPRKLNRT